MTWTLGNSTDLKGDDLDSGYKNGPLWEMTWALGTSTDLYWEMTWNLGTSTDL